MGVNLITAVPTPFTADESLDIEGVRRLYRDIASRPIDGAMLAGTTGEFTALSFDERVTTMKIALEEFEADRAYLHVGAAYAREAVALTRAAVELGATRLVAITPYYFPAPPEASVEYFARVAEAAPGVKTYAYLFQARTTTVTPTSVLSDLQEAGLAGVKISGETDEAVAEFLSAAPEGFEVYSGNDVSFGTFVRAGGVGVISGVSSVFPEPFIRMRDALRSGDTERAAALEPLIAKLVRVVKAGGIRQLKLGLELRGMPAGPARSAVDLLEPTDRGEIEAALREVRGE